LLKKSHEWKNRVQNSLLRRRNSNWKSDIKWLRTSSIWSQTSKNRNELRIKSFYINKLNRVVFTQGNSHIQVKLRQLLLNKDKSMIYRPPSAHCFKSKCPWARISNYLHFVIRLDSSFFTLRSLSIMNKSLIFKDPWIFSPHFVSDWVWVLKNQSKPDICLQIEYLKSIDAKFMFRNDWLKSNCHYSTSLSCVSYCITSAQYIVLFFMDRENVRTDLVSARTNSHII